MRFVERTHVQHRQSRNVHSTWLTNMKRHSAHLYRWLTNASSLNQARQASVQCEQGLSVFRTPNPWPPVWYMCSSTGEPIFLSAWNIATLFSTSASGSSAAWINMIGGVPLGMRMCG